MPRNKKRFTRRRPRKGRRKATSMPQRLDDIIKGCVADGTSVNIGLNDYDFNQKATYKLVSCKVNIATIGVADVVVMFLSAQAQNTVLKTINATLCNSSKTYNFRFPPNSFVSGTLLQQDFVAIANCKICSSAETKTIIYSVQVMLHEASDIFITNPDPVHFRRKDGIPPVPSLDSMALT